MTHPHQLHAQAAAASLRVALVSLGHGAQAERYGWAAAGDGIRSTTWSTGGRGAGGHGDPVATAVTDTVRTRFGRRGEWTQDSLVWLAGRLQLPTGAPLDALEHAIPRLRPSTAWQLTLWLRELDAQCRVNVGLAYTLDRFETGHCPACGAWRWRTSGDFLLCRNEICLCAGDACACTMPVKADGAQHIWAPARLHLADPGKVRGYSLHSAYVDEWNPQ